MAMYAPIFPYSRRARQIQVDEGITPAPYRPPAMRDGPSPPTQDINGLRQVKGRARAGTLPSSWASTDQQRSSSPLASRLDAASEADSNSDFGDAMGRSRSSSTVSAFGAAHNAFSSGLGAARSGTDLHNAAIGPPPGLGGLSSASRIRSGSLTLPSSGFDNAFGPSIFSSWQPNRSGLSAGAGGSSGSRVGNMGNDDVRSLQSNDALDGTEAHVRTLDYLGLADVAPFSSSSLRPAQSVTHSGRSSPLGLGLSNAQLSMPSRHRASTLSSTARPRPSAAAAAARTRSSSFITSGVQEGLIEDNEDELVDQEGPGSYTPVSSAYQNSLASAALHNRLGQLSGTSTDYNAAAHAASSAAAAATRPRAISMGVLDNPQNGQQGMNYGLGNDSFSDEDIYAAYAIEHGLDPAAFAAAAAAAGLPPLSRSGQQGGNAHGRHRAGTVATVPGGPGGRQRNEQELLRMAKMMSGPGSASMLAGDAPSYFNVAPSDAYMPSGVPSGGASPSLHRTSSSASISGLGGSGQPPSRSLWIGNLDPGTTGQELMQVFAPYGAIESLRLLPEKVSIAHIQNNQREVDFDLRASFSQECGFVNFVEMSDAIRARDDVLNRLGGKIGTGGNGPNATVRIGFGKVDSAPSAPGSVGGFGSRGFPSARADGGVNTDGYPGTPGEAPTAPTRALWVGSIPSTTTPAVLLSIFTPFGPIESARVLTHKNCGFGKILSSLSSRVCQSP